VDRVSTSRYRDNTCDYNQMIVFYRPITLTIRQYSTKGDIDRSNI
jgi:hypothetical protein